MAENSSRPPRPLNPRQLEFVRQYVICRNGAEAARRAGYSVKGVDATASKLTVIPKIRAAIDKELRINAEKAGLTAERVLREIQKLAFVDLTDAYADDGNFLPLREMPDDVRASLQGMETDEIKAGRGRNKRTIGVTRKIKLADKVRALDMLARHFKLLTDVQEITGKDGAPLAVVVLPENKSEKDGEENGSG